MKPKLNAFEWGMLAVFMIATGIGIYFCHSINQRVYGEEKGIRLKIDGESEKLKKVIGRRYLPDRKNLEALESNRQALEQVIGEISPLLKRPEGRLTGVKELEAVDFKQGLTERVRTLTAHAREKFVKIPKDYFFGFSKYKAANPQKSATIFLGKQLVAIEQIASSLFDSEVSELESILRTQDEEGAIAAKGGGGADSLKGEIYEDGRHLYVVYPFEVHFVGTTDSLRKFMNQILASPYVFVIRSCQVANMRPVPLRKDQMESVGKAPSSEEAMAAEGVAHLPGVGGVKPPKPILGDELLKIQIRLDLIEWKELAEEKPAKKT